MIPVEHAIRALLTEGVQDGTLTPGAQLPTERALVDRLGAPRSAIRRALEALEREGLVIRHVGRGTFLTDTATQTSAAPADTSPTEIMQVRQLLEPQITLLAARAATQADLTRITTALTAGAEATNFQNFEQADATLHRSIALAAHNGLLMSMFDVMNTARSLPIWGTLKHRTSTPALRRCYQAEHTAVVEALHDRDPQAAADAMRTHLIHVADTLLPRT